MLLKKLLPNLRKTLKSIVNSEISVSISSVSMESFYVNFAPIKNILFSNVLSFTLSLSDKPCLSDISGKNLLKDKTESNISATKDHHTISKSLITTKIDRI